MFLFPQQRRNVGIGLRRIFCERPARKGKGFFVWYVLSCEAWRCCGRAPCVDRAGRRFPCRKTSGEKRRSEKERHASSDREKEEGSCRKRTPFVSLAASPYRSFGKRHGVVRPGKPPYRSETLRGVRRRGNHVRARLHGAAGERSVQSSVSRQGTISFLCFRRLKSSSTSR